MKTTEELAATLALHLWWPRSYGYILGSTFHRFTWIGRQQIHPQHFRALGLFIAQEARRLQRELGFVWSLEYANTPLESQWLNLLGERIVKHFGIDLGGRRAHAEYICDWRAHTINREITNLTNWLFHDAVGHFKGGLEDEVIIRWRDSIPVPFPSKITDKKQFLSQASAYIQVFMSAGLRAGLSRQIPSLCGASNRDLARSWKRQTATS